MYERIYTCVCMQINIPADMPRPRMPSGATPAEPRCGAPGAPRPGQVGAGGCRPCPVVRVCPLRAAPHSPRTRRSR